MFIKLKIKFKQARVGSALSVVAKTTYNNTFKFALAKLGSSPEEAKAHSFTKLSLAMFSNVLGVRRLDVFLD